MCLKFKRAAVAALLLAGLALSGCSSSTIYYEYREIEKLELIRTIGIDKETEGVTITVCSGIGLSGAEPKIIKKTGKTIAEALDNIQNNPAGREPFYSHVDHIIIGEDAVKDGIGDYLDFVFRTTEIRFGANLFIVKGGRASDLMEGTVGEQSSAADMLQLLSTNLYKMGDGAMLSCEEVGASIAESGSSLAFAIEAQDTNEANGKSGDKMIVPAGFAILKDGRLSGFVPKELAHSASVILGKKSLGDLVAENESGDRVVFSYSSIKSKVTPVFSGDKLEKINIEITCKLNVEEVMDMVNLLDEDTRREFARQAAERELNGAVKVIQLAQEKNIDFLNIKKLAELKKPVKIAKLSNSWDELFPNLRIEITAKAMLDRTYDISNPIDAAGGGSSEKIK